MLLYVHVTLHAPQLGMVEPCALAVGAVPPFTAAVASVTSQPFAVAAVPALVPVPMEPSQFPKPTEQAMVQVPAPQPGVPFCVEHHVLIPPPQVPSAVPPAPQFCTSKVVFSQ